MTRDPSFRALAREVSVADDPRVLRIVAAVDALGRRGDADGLIAPLRQRLQTLRPPRPLRFARLLFHPFDPVIVPAPRWRPGHPAIPRTAITPVAEHVRTAMGGEAADIDRAIAGKTTADTATIVRLGRTLWPLAATIMAAPHVPGLWETTGLGDPAYPPLAGDIAAILAEAPALDAFCAEAALGLHGPGSGALRSLLGRLAKARQSALPMTMAMLLARAPDALRNLPAASAGAEAAAWQAAKSRATDAVLRQLDVDGGTEAQLASGSLADAGSAAARIASMLAQLDESGDRQRRDTARGLLQRLDAGCKARFVAGLEGEFLAPLLTTAGRPPVRTLEAAARGLRMLETQGRRIGSARVYDALLEKAVEAIEKGTTADRIGPAGQIRLVEILAGPDAALALADGSRD